MKLNIDEIKNKVTEDDLKKLSTLIGEHGDEVVTKLKGFLK